MTKLMKTLNVFALAAILLAPAASLAERISKHTDSEGFEDWYWAKSVTVKNGNAHTFVIKGLSANTCITDVEVYCDYTYEEDGETYEDFVFASEYCEVVNSSGGFDKYVLLSSDDWEWVPSSKNFFPIAAIVPDLPRHAARGELTPHPQSQVTGTPWR